MIAVVVWRLLVGGYEEAIGFYRMCSYWAGDSTDLLNHSRSIRHNLFVAVLPDINFPLPFPKEKNYFTLLVTGFLKSTAIHHGGDNEQSCHLPQAEQCPGSLQAVASSSHSSSQKTALPPAHLHLPPCWLLGMVWNILLVHWGQLSHPCSLLLLLTACPLTGDGGRVWNTESLNAVQAVLSNSKMAVCYWYCFSQNPRHSTILPAMNKVKSTLGRSSNLAHV